ncbi:MAG: glycosyltransferase family 2 protein [Eubacteriales bacterium]|nr:glycosyltransferase family 2 protein [Eubacteriales bacterium]
MNTAAVILNYNDTEGTVDAVKRINGFFCFDEIIVVDNASPDGSAERLESAFSGMDKVWLVKAEKNGGYGCGNNLGIRYAAEHFGAELALIANPDAIFDETLIKDMAAVFSANADTGAVGAVMKPRQEAGVHTRAAGRAADISCEEYILSGWKRRGPLSTIAAGAPLLRRLMKGMLNYPDSYYEGSDDPAEAAEAAKSTAGATGSVCAGGAVRVYAVHGSLLMVSVERFLKCKGYDENIFLYGEENVLAEKFLKAGFSTLLLKETYEHEGSKSITGSGLGAVKRQKLRGRSELYFIKNYLNAGKLSMAAARILQAAVLFETRLAVMLHLI